jgi:DNA-binding GntR family transcriptional regulator
MPTTLKTSAYRLIRHRVARGTLPPGTRVSETALSKELGTSRAPVREAIKDLINEGLVEQVGNVGAFVKKPARADLEDLYEVREWLECEAVAKAAGRITSESLVELENACNQLKAVIEQWRGASQVDSQMLDQFLYQAEAADAQFHLGVISACANRQVLDLVANKHMLSRIWGVVPCDWLALESLEGMYREHCQTLEDMRRGDAPAARDSMRHHIRVGREQALRAYDRQQRQEAIGGQIERQWPQALNEDITRLEDKKGV